MYFKKLEMAGFKSFLSKTKLKFEPGVTGIVGPNGCGKSNIVDAIKWVLGEQSAKSMRSSSMQDVIFNGTEKYDPVNIAEVSLTLSNEDRALPVDYDEVTISRRLYRSGESEYLLNKMPVRLSDVRNLLMGTGIGTSSYSIFEQGKMDMMLSSKPEERRYIFEEASGITRYKTKKKEALLKLEHTQENLVRISDIIREVERQINSIERQARKAERYKSRYEELKDLDVKISYRKFKALGTDDTSLGQENGKLKQSSEDISSQLEGYSASLARLRKEFSTILQELHDAQNEMTRLSSDTDKNKHVIEVNGERIRELGKYAERLKHEIDESIERRVSLESRLDGLRRRFSEVSAKRQTADAELASAENKVKELAESVEEHKNELKLSREKTVDIISEQTKIKNTSIKISADIQNTQSRIKRLKMEKNGVQAEKDGISEKLKSAEEKAESTARDLENRKREFDIFNDKYILTQQELVRLSSEKSEKERRLNEIRPRRQFLEKLVSEREGMDEGVKMIMERVEAGDPDFSGIHGILSELINVNEDYQESMESILGDAAHAIVVDSRPVEEKMVRCLEKNAMGSVNFIVLDELKRLLGEAKGPGITKGTLDDVTHVLLAREPYHSALRILLSDTFVTVSTEAARIFMDESSGFKGRIIGEKGEVYRKGIRRSRNYSTKEGIPLFGRREKAAEMREEEDRITREVEKVAAAVKELEGWLEESASKKKRLESELREKQMEFADISSKKAAIKEKFDSLEEELFLLGSEVEQESVNARQMQDEKTRIDLTLEELDAENARIQQAIEASRKTIQDGNRQRETMLFAMSDIKADLSAFRKEEENLSENLSREEDSFYRMDRAIEEKRKSIDESSERIKALEEEMKTLAERNLEHVSLIEIRGGKISEKKERKDSMDRLIREGEEQVKEKERELEELRNRTRDLDIRKKEVEYKRDALAEKIFDHYKVDIKTLDTELDNNTDWEDAARSVDELKASLEKMGEVSLGAVEEHKQLEERFRFLTSQRDDLVKGRESLMQAITKINRTTRKMFMETFESIRKEFNNYFRMLFNGGKAELILQDESNVLECGIDIVVRPPGKKLHNIMQLSGGEKAMTAIALIFAIFKVNPSPFCVLDEIDAPLDESNIVRFCRVLQEFLTLSQFVIVTHNRMTIQLADVLYGITMEEKGISKMVSVKFSEDKEKTGSEAVPVAV